MGKIVPLAIVLVSLLGGAGGGYVLRPPSEGGEAVETPPEHDLEEDTVVKFRDSFVIPVLRDGQIWSHVILSLGVESAQTPSDQILLREPILRDGLTEALFLHASLGGFDGNFTEALSLNRLRVRLNEVLTRRLSDPSARVLIEAMARQSE